jgi:phosphatidate cytidylyltransferase
LQGVIVALVGEKSMLKERVITACILFAALLLALFSFAVEYFQYFMIAVFAIAAWEWANLSSLQHQALRIGYAIAIAASLFFLIDYTGINNEFYLSVNADKIRDVFRLGCMWWAIALLWVKTYPGSSALWGTPVLRALMGIFVLLPAAMALMYLRGLNNGQWYFLYVVGIVIAADVGAYFAGRAFGKHKLAVKVSPGKTIEGFIGGLAACGLYAFVVSQFYSIYSLNPMQLVIITMVAALASVLGDLVESMVKRHRGIKDSSQLLPGHGGVMDRIDSICAAAPVFALLGILV